jgi:protein SCO1/2
MTSRRAFLTSVAAAAPAALAGAAAAEPGTPTSPFLTCPSAGGGPNAKRFPHVVVQDQNGRRAWFYEELINGRIVLVSFSSVKGEKYYPVVPNLVKVQEMLEDRLGDDVFLYTISTDPSRDTPDRLRELADRHGAKWQLLTGEPAAVREVLTAFNVRGTIHGLAWVGNEKTGRWLSKAATQHPLFIAEAVARLSTGKRHKPFLIDMRSV